jgi:hypothetical protein
MWKARALRRGSVLKVWLTPNNAIVPTGPADADGGLVLPMAYHSVRTHEGTSPEASSQVLRRAVHAYARDPSQRNAVLVEAAIEALRRQKASSGSRQTVDGGREHGGWVRLSRLAVIQINRQ